MRKMCVQSRVRIWDGAMQQKQVFFVLPFQFSALTTGTRRCYTVIVNLSSSDYIRLYLILDGVYSRGYGSSATMVVIYPPY